jgi:hypothetical protein
MQNIDLNLARSFCESVKELAEELGLNVFVVTDGASAISNNGNDCVRFHRKMQVRWEKAHGYDPNEDWSSQL